MVSRPDPAVLAAASTAAAAETRPRDLTPAEQAMASAPAGTAAPAMPSQRPPVAGGG
jgi:hypothetical protein